MTKNHAEQQKHTDVCPIGRCFGIWFNECFAMSHTIRGQMCVCLPCVLLCQYNKNIKNSERLSMCGCAIFVCGGMCFDALSDMFRTLCAPRPVFVVCFDVFVFVTAILIQRSQYSQDDRDVSHPGRTQTRVHRSNVSLSAFSLNGLAVPSSKWKHVSLQRAILAWH